MKGLSLCGDGTTTRPNGLGDGKSKLTAKFVKALLLKKYGVEKAKLPKILGGPGGMAEMLQNLISPPTPAAS